MRTEPTWRIPVGILGLLAALSLYGIAIANFVHPLIGGWAGLAQAAIYAGLGLVWLLPLKRFLIWMETGRWG
ncbi:DUF2842 domain-containing protein [Qipengyuania sediminis]|uniref:DUF2842 domain-containing protein n=1 Tax=Qipengyuania sediminis TaxID=1532023 RepID=UPI001059F37C|nr:DUF2842 domain-containing protein [Qipengyuania sediminis]